MITPMLHPDLMLELFKARERESMEEAEQYGRLKAARADSLLRQNRFVPKIGDFLVAFGVWLKVRGVARLLMPSPETALRVRAPFPG